MIICMKNTVNKKKNWKFWIINIIVVFAKTKIQYLQQQNSSCLQQLRQIQQNEVLGSMEADGQDLPSFDQH